LDHKLTYRPSNASGPFITYSNANHKGNLDNCRSTDGYVVKIGTGIVSWSLKLQTLVALSIIEAEYISTVKVRKEIIWMHQFLGELGYKIPRPSVLWMDNQSAIEVSKNPEHHGKMKHLSLCLSWLRDVVEDNVILPQFMVTQNMAADIFIKALDRFKCRNVLGCLD
jgi:hypothetical protein